MNASPPPRALDGRIRLVRPELPAPSVLASDFESMFATGRLTNFGPYSRRFEAEIAEHLGVRHAVAVSNATTGLILALSSMPRGHEVIVPSFTFLPTVQAVLWNGLVPVFADVEHDTMNVSARTVQPRIGPRTCAILAVNAFGLPCPVDELTELARSSGVSLFFDSAHAIGASMAGRPVGGFGQAEVFSLSATKLLPCGEGGIVATNDTAFHTMLLDRRNYGFSVDSCRVADRPAQGTSASQYECRNLGLNAKITEYAAILGLHGLPGLTERIARRRDIAAYYRSRLGVLPGLSFQVERQPAHSAWKDFVVVVNEAAFGMSRDSLRRRLDQMGIETASYFCPAVHQFEHFRSFVGPGHSLAVTESLQGRILSLPLYSTLQQSELEYVVSCIESCAG